jgi:erythromycin esterase
LSRRNFLLASASALMVSACATQVAGGPAAVSGPTMTSLLAAQAVPIRRLEADDAGVRALAARLSRARMVGLGEATHGSHEDALLKSMLIQAMVENHGLRTILVEANRTGTAEMNAYTSAAPTGLMAAEAVKQAPVFSILKTEVLADLLTWLRGWNAVNGDQPVRLVGIDCQNSSRDAAEALLALSKIDSGTADALAASLAPILTDEAKALRHDRMIRSITAAELGEAEAACQILEGDLKRAGNLEAAYIARLAWQGLNAFAYETSDSDPSAAEPDYWSRRDVFMAENARHVAGNDKAVFWAHNMHVLGAQPANDAAKGFLPWGAKMRAAYGPDYAALVQDFSKASFRVQPQSGDGPMTEIRRTARPGTLNALLTAASPRRAWFDLSDLPDNTLVNTWRTTPLGYDWYGARAPAEPSDADILYAPPDALMDFMVIHPQLTPSRML